MRVFVVGATGVLGRALVPLLLARGHAVRALVRSPERAGPLVEAGADVVPGDLLEPELATRLPDLLAGCQAVIHAATAIPRDPAAPGAWEATTRLRTEGTRRLLDAALAAGAGRYLQQSIVMAYPDGGDRWLDEGTPLDDSAARAAVCAPVAAMEGMVRATDPERLSWCILRGGIFVGPGTGQSDLIARVRAGRVVVPGDGGNYLSPIHVADMAAAIVAALHSAPAGSTFNVVDEPLRYGDYVDRLADLLGASRPPRDPARPRPPSCRCTNRAAREALSWVARHSIGPA